MDIREAIKERHSVRQYKDIPLGKTESERLEALI